MANTLGVHYILEFCGCQNAELLKNVDDVDHVLVEAANRGKATVVSHHFHQFEPWGVSGVVILQESHITIHTWPEHGYAAIDVFFCNLSVDMGAIRSYMEEKFRPARVEQNMMSRGTAAHLRLVSNGAA